MAGLWFSLNNLKKSGLQVNTTPRRLFILIMPMGALLTATAVAMIVFYTN
jgi:hypothetical protein